MNTKKIFLFFLVDILNSKLIISIENPFIIFSMTLFIILSKKEGPSFFSILFIAYFINSSITFFLSFIIIFSISLSSNSEIDVKQLILLILISKFSFSSGIFIFRSSIMISSINI